MLVACTGSERAARPVFVRVACFFECGCGVWGLPVGRVDFEPRRRATFITSSIVSAKTRWMPFKMCLGISSRSFLFRFGRITVVSLARLAAKSFSFNPPMGRTRPRRVISPVIARSRRTGICDNVDAMAMAMVMPADGPSFGIAPAGTWIWRS